MATEADIAAVEIDLSDGISTQTLRLSNVGPITVVVPPQVTQYEPRLYVPFLVGSRIAAENYGQAIRSSGATSNTIEFALDEALWPWLRYSWLGRTFRAYVGNALRRLDRVYEGRVAGLQHDTLKATVQTTDASIDLDNPLVSDLYPDDALASLAGRPKPRLWGQAHSIEPVLEDEANQVYRVSTTALDDILDVRVGGIPWGRVSGTPAQGQWSPNLAAGTFTLGAVTLGGGVRCDAKAVGWESLTTAALLTQIVEDAGGTVDSVVMDAFERDVPFLVGYYASDPVNRLSVLDEIALGAGAWWGFDASGRLGAAALAAPSGVPDLALTDAEIASLQLMQVLPPAWRVRVEWQRNWSPETQFFSAVTEADQQAQSASGVITPAYENDAIQSAEPRAVDVPLIRSLVATQADAMAIRDRLAAAWGVTRRLYDVTAYTGSDALSLYETVGIKHMMVNGRFRAHEAARSLGGGASYFRLWG